MIIAFVVYGLGKGTESVFKIVNNSAQKLSASEELASNPISDSSPSLPLETEQKPAPANPFKSVSFPLDSCGDNLPKEDSAYPVSFYPVFISYNESDFSNVKANYCRDALKKNREQTNREEIQVASFTSQERANQFKVFMTETFGSGEVGEPTIVEAKTQVASAEPPRFNQSQASFPRTVTRALASRQLELDCSPNNPALAAVGGTVN